MGALLSFDKYSTSLETLVGTAPAAFAKVSAQYQDSGCGHLLKAWRVSSESALTDELNFLSSDVKLSRHDCYIVLLVRSIADRTEKPLVPAELQGTVESLENLTPKGLQSAFSRNLDKKEAGHRCVIFLWHGKAASAGVKANALVKAYELEEWLDKDSEHVLNVLLGGGRVTGGKVKKGERVPLVRLLKSDDGLDPVGTAVQDFIKWITNERSSPEKQFTRYKERVLSQSECNSYVRVEVPVHTKVNAPSKPAFSLNLGAMVSREDERKHITAKPNLTLQDIEEDEDIRYTNRAQLKMEMFTNAISELSPGLFVGGDVIARDKNLLKEKGVTHIINCAGNVCGNYYPEDFKYLSYFLKDSSTESIECVFHETTQFINAAITGGGKVLVHCMQGVSRSVTVCLAYIIFKERRGFDSIFKEAREKRGVCSPNFGFQVQLMWWHKRLEGDAETLPFPRVFAVGSHEVETPGKIVVRMLRTVPYSQGPEACHLDPRGIFLVQSQDALFIWEGAEVYSANVNAYRQAIETHISLLQQFEHAPGNIYRVKQGSEDAAFWESLKQSVQPVDSYKEESGWSHWYPRLDTAQDQEPRALGGESTEAIADERPTLYVYPELQGLTVFDDDELGEETLLCLCSSGKLFVWTGMGFQPDTLSIEEFRSLVLQKHWGEKASTVEVSEELQNRESEEFLSFF